MITTIKTICTFNLPEDSEYLRKFEECEDMNHWVRLDASTTVTYSHTKSFTSTIQDSNTHAR